ncbi:MAG: hypothetical protein RBT38_07280 [Bacteroidales bacterium]|jgi:hypothetical protein|nr:hypothetical protein [Bacteroidales bacterium]
MKGTKTIRYSVIIIPLLLLLLFLLRERSPFGKSNTSFAAKPEREITRIEFSDGKSLLTLEQKEGIWLVNNRFEARKSSIMFINRILTEMEIKSPVSDELFETVAGSSGTEPVRVKVSERGKTISSFLVYKTASNPYGNIMKIKENSKPYIVHVPGSEIEIGSAFTMNELYWQPYTVYNLMPSEIVTVALQNHRDPSSSFRIEKSGNLFRLFGDSGELTGWDTSRITRYLSYFVHVPFESWASGLSDAEKREIAEEEPVYSITISTEGKETNTLRLWERTTGENEVRKTDTDRILGKKDGAGDIFVLRFTDIDPLLKKLSYFFGN